MMKHERLIHYFIFSRRLFFCIAHFYSSKQCVRSMVSLAFRSLVIFSISDSRFTLPYSAMPCHAMQCIVFQKVYALIFVRSFIVAVTNLISIALGKQNKWRAFDCALLTWPLEMRYESTQKYTYIVYIIYTKNAMSMLLQRPKMLSQVEPLNCISKALGRWLAQFYLACFF